MSGASARVDTAAPQPCDDEQPTHPVICIVVPTLDEQDYIGACLASLIGQCSDGACEIIVADGGSTDATRRIVEDLQRAHPVVRLIDNPRRRQAAAVNLAARLASPQATVLVRADAHLVYPADFVRTCVSALLHTGATSVVVPMRNAARPGARVQRAIADAQSSVLGNGGARHRARIWSGFVDHGHHAAFDRSFFQSIGGYDETFTHNEDAEFDLRAVAAGGRIWMCGDALVTYFPRTTLRALATQYARHGNGRGRTLLKHRMKPKPRQMAPVAVLLGLAAGMAAAPFWPPAAAGVLAYPLACMGWGACRAMRRRDPWLMLAGPALMVMHLGWASGFLRAVATARLRSHDRPGPELPGLTLCRSHPPTRPGPSGEGVSRRERRGAKSRRPDVGFGATSDTRDDTLEAAGEWLGDRSA